jgi:outer membrane protein assembly factor BamA
MLYEGEIIRNIYIESIGFEKSIYGNEKPITQKIGRTANKLHTNTREKTIRQHLFIRPNEPLNPYKLGDNERFLRNTDFILESRFVITPIDNSDSVDITIVTRDVFSIRFSGGGSFPSAPKFNLYDANLDGRGQRIEFNILFDQDRKSKTGFRASFTKSSFLGSFTDLQFFYTQLNSRFSYGDGTEYATGIIIDRQLLSQYSRMAGGANGAKTGQQTYVLGQIRFFWTILMT